MESYFPIEFSRINLFSKLFDILLVRISHTNMKKKCNCGLNVKIIKYTDLKWKLKYWCLSLLICRFNSFATIANVINIYIFYMCRAVLSETNNQTSKIQSNRFLTKRVTKEIVFIWMETAWAPQTPLFLMQLNMKIILCFRIGLNESQIIKYERQIFKKSTVTPLNFANTLQNTMLSNE